ncbi:alpha/beta hydrolase [Sphingomonas psychrotolerans]|uniref:Alpha/beta hydrolase n=1 Tax=Sphingomonas psychrotolerans TaxID=1327635 RepID=A0ABU3N2T7_9SPHN|nr:alpha/beta hydrolase [Sphingomonas psychrotolerans]MDT8758184.1 alpha/beta hydrolase [Sphingomonas psychrotolerans]
MRGRLIAAALFAATAIVPAEAQTAAGPHEVAYGGDRLQRLDLYAPRGGSAPAPLFVFVHGGGWRQGDKGNATGPEKVAHFTGRGFAFASVNYRLVPGAKVEDQAQDIADAVGYLVRHARTLGIDAGRIVLAGHSAGAHLSALVATDPEYLKRAGVRLDQLDGVLLLDGAAYDVPAQRQEGPRIMQRVYAQAFGDDPARQRALSPTLQAAAPNAPAFLILHVDRADGARQSDALGAALRRAGAEVTVEAIEGRGLRGHMAINRSLGDAEYPATAIVDRWIDGVIRR